MNTKHLAALIVIVLAVALSQPLHARTNQTKKPPDITSKKGITIGGQSAPWGGNIHLNQADSFGLAQRWT